MSMHGAARADTLTCPKCAGDMRIQRFPESDGYRCADCHGLWLPLMANEQLEERAAEIDTERYAGVSAPEPRTLACPECEFTPLIRMVDAARPDIHFESCKRCYGRYYDAGEFREVSEDPSFLQRLFGRD
ncbi:MAG TPA: zf-TFIIB domain-containing protein [Thermomonas sp.]|nr:zf-TFIIB domain-containing protein [Thermomonas sp.]